MAVQEIDDKQFKTSIKEGKPVIVKFYADWCGACKLMTPKFKRLSEEDAYSGLSFYDINAEKNDEARKLAGVDSLPFFAAFKDGELLEGTATSKIDKVKELAERLAN